MNAARDVLLIGPAGAGKTATAPYLAEKRGQSVVSVDQLRWGYFAEIGYDAEYANKLRDANLHALARYWKLFEVHTVERVLADYENCVFDFGASYTVQDDPVLWTRVKAAFAPYKHVVLLLPSPDPEESLRITIARLEAEAEEVGRISRPELVALNRHFIESSCNTELATLTIYTGDKPPDVVAQEIIEHIGE